MNMKGYKILKIQDKPLRDKHKQWEIVEEALNNYKSVGQVRFYAVDPDDNEFILEGVIFDEAKKCWIDCDDKMELSREYKEAFIQYSAKKLLTKNHTCQFAMFAKEIAYENLAMKIDLDEVMTLLECYGYVVKRATDLDKQKVLEKADKRKKRRNRKK